MSNLKASSIFKHVSVTQMQIFKLRKIKGSRVWGNDKWISTFWEKATFEKARLNKCFKTFSNLVEDTALGSRTQMSTFFLLDLLHMGNKSLLRRQVKAISKVFGWGDGMPQWSEINLWSSILDFMHLTLDSGINVGVRLLIFGLFSSGYVLIKGGTFINFFIFYFSIFFLLFSFSYV